MRLFQIFFVFFIMRIKYILLIVLLLLLALRFLIHEGYKKASYYLIRACIRRYRGHPR